MVQYVLDRKSRLKSPKSSRIDLTHKKNNVAAVDFIFSLYRKQKFTLFYVCRNMSKKFQGLLGPWYQKIEGPHIFTVPHLVSLISFINQILK